MMNLDNSDEEDGPPLWTAPAPPARATLAAAEAAAARVREPTRELTGRGSIR